MKTTATPQSDTTEGQVINRLNARIAAAGYSLHDVDRLILHTIEASPSDVLLMSVTELAHAAGTATSSVVRTCQRLGLQGFQDLKLLIAQDLYSTSNFKQSRVDGITVHTPTNVMIDRILAHSAATIENISATLDVSQFEQATNLLAKASRIVVIGNGTSSAPAIDAAYRLKTIGKIAESPLDPYSQHLSASSLNNNDCCLVISHTGATKETLLAAKAAAEANAPIVAITSFMSSPLTQLASVNLIAGGAEQNFRQEATTSRLAHLAVIDALFVSITLTNPDSAEEALTRTATIRSQHTL